MMENLLPKENDCSMKLNTIRQFCKMLLAGLLLLAGSVCHVLANPAGGNVSQGSASISGMGTSQVTINQTSANAFINWNSFNISAGETTTFNQPSSSSVTWNYIGDPNVSSINGNLNANGYVILQNPNGFTVGGSAVINAHGLVMTTASTPNLDLSGGGAWAFDAPPPTAKIVNYGQINIAGGGSAYLIASDIENNGTISAPNGKIGLYAGQQVLVSMSPDGRGLSAQVTLPQGSVNNQGQLIANAGNIAAQAQTVNQGGLIQANSAEDINGTIELVASGSMNLGANSQIEANGDSAATSPSTGGSVQIQAGSSFSDNSGSSISVTGATQGGSGGQITIASPQMSTIQSSLNGQAAAGYANGTLSIDTANITLNADGSLVTGQLALNANSLSTDFSHIDLQASDNVDVSSLLDLASKNGILDTISLAAGNTITVDPGAGIEVDGGKISLNAQTVNQNGLLQANSIQTANGVVEIDAGSSLNLGATSQITANGDSTATSASPGGFVVLNAGKNTFTDLSGSSISVAGADGGQNGILEIFGNGVTTGNLNSSYGSPYALLINSFDMKLSSAATSIGANPTLNLTALASYSQIDLQALDNITLSSSWNLADSGTAAAINLAAGNNITLNNFVSLTAGKNWDINLTAGTAFTGTATTSGKDGIYLNSGDNLQTLNGDINLWVANEVVVTDGGIRTIGGGNIDVTAEYGSVNSGTSISGYNYLPAGTGTAAAPYYAPSLFNLGGISTASGGNVTINAGADVISFPTTTVAASDPGSGAFGPEAGNVTINAGGNVYGNFVEANGTGTINAGQNIGTSAQNVALSLVAGNWNLNAQNNIYLQEVRNPNGVFNNLTDDSGNPVKGNHVFDYDPHASVSLTAGNGVYLTGYNLPRPSDVVPLLLPPTVIINAGSGGVTLETPNAVADNNGDNAILPFSDYTLFPSAYGNLQITTTDGGGLYGNGNELRMSDSGQTSWSDFNSFSSQDFAKIPAELNNEDPVVLDISGSIENLTLQVTKLTQITVHGDMKDCAFYGQNLNANDVTSITVDGQIYNDGSFTFTTLKDALPDLLQLSLSLPSEETYLPPGSIDDWSTILAVAVDPTKLANLYATTSLLGATAAQLSQDVKAAALFSSLQLALAYNPATKTLTAIGPLSGDPYIALTEPTLTLVRYSANGSPLLDANGHFVTDTIPWLSSANAPLISGLVTASQNASSLGSSSGGYIVGGTGYFDVTAESISLGNAYGILSVGSGNQVYSIGQANYSYLVPYASSGATINVMAGYLQMDASTIAALGGGDVNVTCTGEIPASSQDPLNNSGVGVSMDLGSQALLPFEAQIMAASNIGLGIYTSGGGNVTLTALGTINIDSSRVATLDGGNVNITSLTGDVNAGSGGAIAIPVNSYSPLYSNTYEPVEYVYANGIVADTLAPLPDGSTLPGAATQPGNITVITPEGSIYANLGGILQETLSGKLLPGPYITLEAGTPYNDDWNSTETPIYNGDVELGNSGVIGGTVNVNATGKVTGLLISSQNANITSQSVGSLTVLAIGIANVSSQGSSGGITIIGGQGVNASGIGSGALLLGQNVSVNGGAAQSTLGTSASSTATSQSAAGQASSEAQQQVASNGDDDQKKKKKPQIRKMSRVTVLLSAAVPPR
jgi:filamentous hemagglutinin family protein